MCSTACRPEQHEKEMTSAEESQLPLLEYLEHRSLFPLSVRQRLDALARAGEGAIPLRAAAFAAEMARLQPLGSHQEAVAEVSQHWYEEIIRGG